MDHFEMTWYREGILAAVASRNAQFFAEWVAIELGENLADRWDLALESLWNHLDRWFAEEEGPGVKTI